LVYWPGTQPTFVDTLPPPPSGHRVRPAVLVDDDGEMICGPDDVEPSLDCPHCAADGYRELDSKLAELRGETEKASDRANGGPPDAGGPPGPPSAPPGPQLSKCEIALILLAQHPDWTVTRIAKEAQINRTQLYRCKRFFQALEASKGELPRGMKSADGRIEAYDEIEDDDE
jgi:hypothetical protein